MAARQLRAEEGRPGHLELAAGQHRNARPDRRRHRLARDETGLGQAVAIERELPLGMVQQGRGLTELLCAVLLRSPSLTVFALTQHGCHTCPRRPGPPSPTPCDAAASSHTYGRRWRTTPFTRRD